MRPRHVVALVCAALAVFAAGVLSSHLFVGGGLPVSTSVAPVKSSDAPRPPASAANELDAGASPTIVFDPDAIRLLPDASLHLDPPTWFDAGEDRF